MKITAGPGLIRLGIHRRCESTSTGSHWQIVPDHDIGLTRGSSIGDISFRDV
jgi:hypothetical protein